MRTPESQDKADYAAQCGAYDPREPRGSTLPDSEVLDAPEQEHASRGSTQSRKNMHTTDNNKGRSTWMVRMEIQCSQPVKIWRRQ